MKRLNLLLLIIALVLAPVASAMIPPVGGMTGGRMLDRTMQECAHPEDNSCKSMAGSFFGVEVSGNNSAETAEHCVECDGVSTAHNCCQLSAQDLLQTSHTEFSVNTNSLRLMTLCRMHNAPCYPIDHPPQ